MRAQPAVRLRPCSLTRRRLLFHVRAADKGSSYEDTSVSSKVSKGLVSALTAVVNTVVPPREYESRARDSNRPAITPNDVYEGETVLLACVRQAPVDLCVLAEPLSSLEKLAAVCLQTGLVLHLGSRIRCILGDDSPLMS